MVVFRVDSLFHQLQPPYMYPCRLYSPVPNYAVEKSCSEEIKNDISIYEVPKLLGPSNKA